MEKLRRDTIEVFGHFDDILSDVRNLGYHFLYNLYSQPYNNILDLKKYNKFLILHHNNISHIYQKNDVFILYD